MRATLDPPEPEPVGAGRSVVRDGEAAGPDATPDRGRRAAGLAWPRRWLARFSPAGVAVAIAFWCLSLTPSLIPRTWLYQGLITGLCAIGGYGIGAFAQWAVRLAGFRTRWSARVRRRAWWTVAGGAAVVVPLFVVLGHRWQQEQRELFGMPPDPASGAVATAAVALVLALLVLALARGVGAAVRAVSRLVPRLLPRPVAHAIAVVVVAALVVVLANGVLWSSVRGRLEQTYTEANDEIDPDLVAPAQAERSGSAASPSTWESLGAEGRAFVAGGPTADELAVFAARVGADPAAVREPIRVYAGLDRAGSLQRTAAAVVAELDRTDAWDRSVLVVGTSTGTGWVDPGAVAALELLWGGDTAYASMQYSYLPSWISFVGDRESPVRAGRALYEAVFEAWSARPEDDRPLLLAFGISLGSYGAQGAFGSLQDLSERSDGALFAGTPGFTPLWAELTAARDAGSPQIRPVLDGGEQVRWGTLPGSAADVWDLGNDWDRPRVVYLQHASDGVTWWSASTLLSRPTWLAEPRGPDVLDAVTWWPVVTFWQLSADLFVAGSPEVPHGHGHNYRLEYADGWAALAAPDGWNDADTAALRTALDEIL